MYRRPFKILQGSSAGSNRWGVEHVSLRRVRLGYMIIISSQSDIED